MTGKVQYGIDGPSALFHMLISTLLRSTAIDSMPSVMLGVMKSLMVLWISEDFKGSPSSLFNFKEIVNDYILNVKPLHFLQRCKGNLCLN